MSCDDDGVCRIDGNDSSTTTTTPSPAAAQTKAKNGKIRIDVLSDNVCPWCYVGKKKMELAIAANPSIDFEVEWHPFFLNSPSEHPEPLPIREYLMKKYGPRVMAMEDHLKKMGGDVGLKFNDNRVVLNTLKSHQLVMFAKKFGLVKQNQVIDDVFKSYFVDAKNTSQDDVLLDIAKRAELPEEEVKALLSSNNLADDVMAEATGLSRQLRVTGVPLFLITKDDKAVKLSGAQDPATFSSAFTQLLKA